MLLKQRDDCESSQRVESDIAEGVGLGDHHVRVVETQPDDVHQRVDRCLRGPFLRRPLVLVGIGPQLDLTPVNLEQAGPGEVAVGPASPVVDVLK